MLKEAIMLAKNVGFYLLYGRRGGLMRNELDSGSNGPGSSPSRGHSVCTWARHLTLKAPLSTQVYKWVSAF